MTDLDEPRKGCPGPDMSAQGDDLAAHRELITLSNQWPEPTVGGAGVAQGDDPLTFLARLAVGGGDPTARGCASGKPSR